MVAPSLSPRRWLGIGFLLVALAMLVLGQTLLKNSLGGVAFAYYWLTCIIFTLLAATSALRDLILIRRESTAERRQLVRETLDELDRLQHRHRSGSR